MAIDKREPFPVYFFAHEPTTNEHITSSVWRRLLAATCPIAAFDDEVARRVNALEDQRRHRRPVVA